MSNTTTTAVKILNIIRDAPVSSIPTSMAAIFLTTSFSDLESLRGWIASPSGGQLMGIHSRTWFMAAVSIAIITTGERADACRPGTSTNLNHLARMDAVDALGTALLNLEGRNAA